MLYSTVSANQLLFVWCSLSDDHQMPVRCLSDACHIVPSDICQLQSEICQTSTTYTPDMYHTPTRHILYHMYTRCPPDIYQTSTRYLSDVWYMSGVHVVYLSDRCLVGVNRCLVGHLAMTLPACVTSMDLVTWLATKLH